MNKPKLLFKPVLGASVALLMLSAGSIATASGRSEATALSASACGMAGGAMADPADTQRCLAERYKAPKPKPARTPAPATPSNTASAAPPASGSTASSSAASATN